MTYDWKATTFSLTVQDAARLLETTPQSMIDLMLSGRIGFYMAADPGREDGLPIDCARFDPADVREFLRREHDTQVSIALPVLTSLRRYLRDHRPTRDYDEALSRGLPLSTRSGTHVRLNSVVDYARETQASPAAQLVGSTEVAFARLGLLRVRGLTPYGEGKQRWGTWFRLPRVIVFDGETVTMDDFLRPAGTLTTGEHVIEALDGSGPVVAQPVHDDEWAIGGG